MTRMADRTIVLLAMRRGCRSRGVQALQLVDELRSFAANVRRERGVDDALDSTCVDALLGGRLEIENPLRSVLDLPGSMVMRVADPVERPRSLECLMDQVLLHRVEQVRDEVRVFAHDPCPERDRLVPVELHRAAVELLEPLDEAFALPRRVLEERGPDEAPQRSGLL